MKDAIVYVDGFNLYYYYGLFRNRNRIHPLSAYKWLDLGKLCSRLLPKDRVHRIRYFTADVSATPKDPDQPIRQQAYLRALQTIPHLQMHKGRFLQTTKRGLPVDAVKHGADLIEVRLFEEKGSDVNIATYLLWDALSHSCEKSVVISNDSDLAEPIRVVRDELGVEIAVISPYPWVTNDLKMVASSSGPLHPRLVRQCQFPSVLVDASGSPILKPRSW
ncbi:MAG: NYN domain-containing protein [Thermomicrobiales bacterium]